MSVSDCLLIKLAIELVYGQNGYFYCLVPRRLSVSMKICAQTGRREEENGRGRSLCLSSFSIPWSIALRQQSVAFSRSPLCQKRSVWGGSSYFYISTNLFFLYLFQFGTSRWPQGPWKHHTEAWMNELCYRDNGRSRAECKFCDHLFYLILDTLWKK